MSEETMNAEETQAVKELIEKIPPEDLEKAVGGLSKRSKKLLKGAGIILATAATVGYFQKDNIKSLLGLSESPAPSTKYDDYYDYHWWRPNTLKPGYKKIDGMIYKNTGVTIEKYDSFKDQLKQMYPKSAFVQDGNNVFASMIKEDQLK